MKKIALIIAGGIGKRMKTSIPKQFVQLNGKPLLMHTFQAFYNYDPQIEFILVLPEYQVKHWALLCKEYQFDINYQLALGGETRYHSVKNGLDLISGEGIVFIHDGVRPLVSRNTIESCFSRALEKGNALPVVQVTESIREVVGERNISVDRSKYFLVQTPQTFKISAIKKAYAWKNSALFTDDASVLESTGEEIFLVEGNRENIKITYPEDILIANILLENRLC